MFKQNPVWTEKESKMTTVTTNDLLVSRTIRMLDETVCKVVYVPNRDHDSFLVIYDSLALSTTRVCNAIQSILSNHMDGWFTDSRRYHDTSKMIVVEFSQRVSNPVTAIKVFNRKLVEFLSQKVDSKTLSGLKPEKTFKLNAIDEQDFGFGLAVTKYLESIHIPDDEIGKVSSLIGEQVNHIEDFLYVYVSTQPPTEGLYFAQKTKPFGERLRVYALADNNLWIWITN